MRLPFGKGSFHSFGYQIKCNDEYVCFVGLDFFCCVLFVHGLYFLFFSLLSLRKRKTRYPQATFRNHFVVLFPAYKEDGVILESVRNFFNQTYSYYDVFAFPTE